MTGESEEPDKPIACPDPLLLAGKFKIDGDQLITAGFLTGPNQSVLILSIGFAAIALLLCVELILSSEASVIVAGMAILTAILALISYRACYLRTMPFEIRFDRDLHKIRITRPDIPDQVIDANQVRFAIQPRDCFAGNTGSCWLITCLPDKKRFFLGDTESVNEAEALRAGLEQWLTGKMASNV